MKLYICGYARHGKDQVAQFLTEDFGLRHESSSHIAMRLFVRTKLALAGITYPDEDACYEDRVNHRKFWYDAILEYNTPDRAKLSREIFKTNDMYVGIRNAEELAAAKAENLADLIIWVDATERVGTIEGKDSNQITPNDCDVVVPNNGTLDELRARLQRLFTGRLVPLSMVDMAGPDMMPTEVIDANGDTVGFATDISGPFFS